MEATRSGEYSRGALAQSLCADGVSLKVIFVI